MFSLKTSEVLPRLFSAGLFLLTWLIASIVLADPQTLPGPLEVFRLIASEAASGELFHHLLATLFRVICTFLIAMSVGVALGLVMGRYKKADNWLDTWLIILLNLPALVTIVLCYLWIGLNEVAAIAAVSINKIPLVTAMIREGARAFDPKLEALAKVYRVSRQTQLRHILIPQLAPHIASAARAGIALIWKIVLVVEFLGRSNGIGFQIHLGFQLFDVALVLAYALSFIIVMLLVETLIVQPIERYVLRWRRA